MAGNRLTLRLLCVIILFLLALPVSPNLGPIGNVEAEPGLITLRVGLTEPLDSLNPYIGVSHSSRIFYSLVYDCLITVDEDGRPCPNLAESWCVVSSIEPVGSVWQYNLTRNATWHDGEPFTASDVRFTINLQTGLNFDLFWAYQPYTAFMAQAEYVDPYTVTIHFQDLQGNPSPCAFGDSMMIPILPWHIWSYISPSDAAFSYVNTFPIGTGPFRCTESTYEEFLQGDSMVLLKNPSYHLGSVQYDRLELRFFYEPDVMVAALQNRSIDVGRLRAPHFESLVSWLASNPDVPIETYSGITCTSESAGIQINQAVSGMNNPTRLDPAVRASMVHATNKSFITEEVFLDHADIGSTLISPAYGESFWSPNETELNDYNISRANEILDAGGYEWRGSVRAAPVGHPYGSETSEILLVYEILVREDSFEDRAVAEYLRDEWMAVGIDLQTVLVSQALWYTLVYSYVYDLALTSWEGDPDPNYLLHTQSTFAIARWSENAYSSAEYDENYSMSVSEMNLTLRTDLLHNCQYHMYKDCALIVTAYPHGCYAWRSDTFSGWGDWGAHPCRSIDAFWSGNPLYLNLTPLILPPSGAFTVSPMLGDLSTVFSFNASSSFDPDGSLEQLEVRWDWEGDGTWDTTWSSNKTAEHQYSVPYSYTVLLEVRDPDGLTDTAQVDIIVLGEIPEFFGIVMPVLAVLSVIVLAAGLGSRRRFRRE